MSERFKPVFQKLDHQGMILYSLRGKTVGDRIFVFNPIVGVYNEDESQTVLYCTSSGLQNCAECPVRDICPRPERTVVAVHSNSIPLETARQYYKHPKCGNPTITNGHPPPVNR